MYNCSLLRGEYICYERAIAIKSLVASCVCVAEVWKRVSTRSSISSAKRVRFQYNKHVRLLFESWKTPPKKKRNLGKKFLLKFISSRGGPEKYIQKQGMT